MKDKSLLIQFMGDTPISRIIDFLIENKGLDFSKTQISEGSGISRTALFAHWQTIEKFGLVKITRTFGKTKLYTLNSESVFVQQILELELKLIDYAMAQAAKNQEQKENAIELFA